MAGQQQYRLRITTGDAWFTFRWPQAAEGMAEWAEDEMRAEFVPATGYVGWHYRLPANEQNALALRLKCPLPIDGDAGFLSRMPGGMSEDGPCRKIGLTTSVGLPDPATIPQPQLRKFDAWGHQRQAGDFLTRRRAWRAILSMAMGTGKTKVVIDAIINDPVIRIGVILCPAKVLGVWRRECRLHGCGRIETLILDESVGSCAEKRAAAERFIDRARHPANRDKVFLVVANYESARTPALAQWLVVQAWDVAVMDESHRAKDPRGKTAKLVDALRIVSKRRVCLTGTPMPHSPGDIFTQARFVDPSLFPQSYFAFLKRYAIRGWHKEIIGWRRLDELREKFHRIAICIGEDVLDLPPLSISDRVFQMPVASRKVYRGVWDEMVGEVRSEQEQTGQVVVANVLAKLIRCQQIACGFAVAEDEAGVKLPQPVVLDDARESELEDLLRDAGPDEKVVVFCRFVHDLAAVRRVVERLEWELNGTAIGNDNKRASLGAAGQWQHYRCGEVSGRCSDLTPDAKLRPDREVFAVQVQSGGVGVDFTAASLAVIYSTDFSCGNYEQMLKRLHRPGQTRPVRVIQLICEGTVDERIYQSIKDKQDVVAGIIADVGSERIPAMPY